MLGLPVTTEYNKRIPKQKFYENLSVTPELKRIFTQQISVIYWRNKIASTTLNVAPGEAVSEIEVFEIKLNLKNMDNKVLQLIDRQIPYHILFTLEFEGLYQLWIGYKEQSLSGQNAFKVSSYYNTEWMQAEQAILKLEGLSLDAIYDNFVKQIAGKRLAVKPAEKLKNAVERDEKRQKLLKQISALEAMVKKEKQFKIQIELNSQLKRLKQELEELL